jgi:VWFA-related protein
MRAGVDLPAMGMLFACLMGGAALCAQQPEAIPKESGVYTLHADTHLVLLDVTVTDKRGHPVPGLTIDDFKLVEDGQPQTIKFFEEHAPVDPAELARQRAAALASLSPNTFTNYEPFTGRPVTVLLLNELFTLPARDFRPLFPEASRLRQRMIEAVQRAPPDTPFAIYMLDSELHLVQPVTTDRALLLARIDVLWKMPHFGSERMINANGQFDAQGMPPAEDIPVRRSILSDAMGHLALSLKAQPGRKSLYVFTGGFQCSVVASPICPHLPFPNDTMDYLCGLMDTLEQGRMSIYRVYPMPGEIAYGFGCPASTDLGSSANYYTLYYTPTNGNWNGKYRATKVEVSDKGLHLAYRKGYYGTPENTEAHYYTAERRAPGPVAPSAGATGGNAPTIAASVVSEAPAAGMLDTAATEPEATGHPRLQRRGSAMVGTGAKKSPPDPAAAVFSVQVVPAETTVVPASAKGAADKKEEYRELTLHLSMPASEFKLTPADEEHYAARLQIAAVGYSDGRLASSNGSQGSEIQVNFNGLEDPRIAKFTITATLTLNALEHGKSRWLYVSVRDVASGRLGSMVIPMEQVKMPATQ